MAAWKSWLWPACVVSGLTALVILGTSQSRLPAQEGGGGDGRLGRYQAISAGGTLVLIDTVTGKTWRSMSAFTPFGGGEFVWVPMHKFDSMDEYHRWRAETERKGFPDKERFFRDKGKDDFPKDKERTFKDKEFFKDKERPFERKEKERRFEAKEKDPVFEKKDFKDFDRKDVDRKEKD